MMIDWVSALVPLGHDTPINGGNVVSFDSDGNIEWSTEKRFSVEGSYGSTIQIRSDHTEGYCSGIRFDGNPVKWFQGHNVWGSDDLLGLLAACLSQVLLRVAPSVLQSFHGNTSEDVARRCCAVEPAKWRNNASELHGLTTEILPYIWCARLTRVDLTVMYDLGNQQRVLTWLRSAQESANMSHRGRGQFRGDTLYWGQNSRRWSLKFYPKGLELKAHKPKKGVVDHPNYLEGVTSFADRALRSEVTIRGLELIRLGLSSVQDWREGVAEKVYSGYLQGLEFSQNMKVTDTPPDLEKLPARLIGPVQLWHSGHDLRTMYPRATWYRYRKEILALSGLDVALPPPIPSPDKPSNVVPLITYLHAKPMQVPDWAKGTDLFFEPPVYRHRLFAVS